MASRKLAYAASSNLDVTSLASIVSSSTWLGGWASEAVDNTSNLYLDYSISGKIAVGNSATAGQIRIYAVPMIDDSTWPDVFGGTQAAETWTDTEYRDACSYLLHAFDTDADGGTDDVYPFHCRVAARCSGNVPAKFQIWITHSTGVNLAASGHQVTIKGEYETVA